MNSKHDHSFSSTGAFILRSVSILTLIAAAFSCQETNKKHKDVPPTPEPGPQTGQRNGENGDRESLPLNLDSPVAVQARRSLNCQGITMILPDTTSEMTVKDAVFAAGIHNSQTLIGSEKSNWQNIFAACVRPELLKSALFFLFGLFISNHPALADASIIPKAPLVAEDGTLIGYESSDHDTYFLIPNTWTLARDCQGPMASLVESMERPGYYDLRLVLEPSYDRARSTVAKLIKNSPNALFFPLSSRMIEAKLFLPPILGSITAQLVPDHQYPSTLAVYYRLLLSIEQVEVIRHLARGNATLQGTMTYAYATMDGEQETTAPLTVQLDANIFGRKTDEDRSVSWLSDMLGLSELYVPRVLDGNYDLGGFVNFTLQNSIVTGSFIHGSQQLVRTLDLVKNVTNGSPNFRGMVTLYIEELDLPIDITYEAHLLMTLDLKSVRVNLQKFDMTSVAVNGQTSVFYAGLMKQLLSDQRIIESLSRELTAELQRRILSNSLFGLKGILS
jgi:hypothetical protein